MNNLSVYYYNNSSAWMTTEIFRDWFVNYFLLEISPIRDDKMQIQLLIDNCSSHNDDDLQIMDPGVFIKYLPPNTTSLIQPMDQAVLALVKAHQKKKFYSKLFVYCDENRDNPDAFKTFLKTYTILDAINDIVEGWAKVPESTIRKSFRYVFPMDTWNAVAGNTFEGFGPQEPEPLQDTTLVVSDIVPGDPSIGQTVCTNDEFHSDIQDIVHNLNNLRDGLVFDKEAVIEDVLLNPGPNDDNVDNILCDVLEVQHTGNTGWAEDMIELSEDTGVRDSIQDSCRLIQGLRFHRITEKIPDYKQTEWRQCLNKLENIILACSEHVPATSSTDEASTSGLSRAELSAAAAAAATTTTTENHSDEASTTSANDDEYNTLNPAYLNCEFGDTYEEQDSLPDLGEDQEPTRTTFRALNEKEKDIYKKFEHVDTSLDSSFD